MDKTTIDNYIMLMKDGVISAKEFEQLTGLQAEMIETTEMDDRIETQSISAEEVPDLSSDENSNNSATNHTADSVAKEFVENQQMAKNKKINFTKLSTITIVCYVIAAVFAIYCITNIFSTIAQINDYYSQYNMSAGFMEYVQYILQNGITPITSVVLIAMAGKIHNMLEKRDK